MSYEALSAPAQQLYRTVSDHPGRDFTLEPLAAAMGVSTDEARRALDDLVTSNLVLVVGEGRYRLQEVLREHSLGLAEQHDDEATRRARAQAMIGWYVGCLVVVDLALNPLPRRFGSPYAAVVGPLPDPADAMAWFAVEQSNLMAAQQLAIDLDLDVLAADLAEALWNPSRLGYADEHLITSQQIGQAAAHRLGDRLRESLFGSREAFGLSNRPDHKAAIRASTAAYELAVSTDDLWLQQTALGTRGRAHRQAGSLDAALEDAREALRLARRSGDRRSVALRNVRLGEIHADLGDLDQAIDLLTWASVGMNDLQDCTGEGRALCKLSAVLLAAGRLSEAQSAARAAVPMLRESGSPGYLAGALTALGDVAHAEGATAEAAALFARAEEFYDQAGPGASHDRRYVRTALDRLRG